MLLRRSNIILKSGSGGCSSKWNNWPFFGFCLGFLSSLSFWGMWILMLKWKMVMSINKTILWSARNKNGNSAKMRFYTTAHQFSGDIFHNFLTMIIYMGCKLWTNISYSEPLMKRTKIPFPPPWTATTLFVPWKYCEPTFQSYTRTSEDCFIDWHDHFSFQHQYPYSYYLKNYLRTKKELKNVKRGTSKMLLSVWRQSR